MNTELIKVPTMCKGELSFFERNGEYRLFAHSPTCLCQTNCTVNLANSDMALLQTFIERWFIDPDLSLALDHLAIHSPDQEHCEMEVVDEECKVKVQLDIPQLNQLNEGLMVVV